MHGIGKSLLWVTASGISINMSQVFGNFLVIHLNGVRKSWGVYLLIALLDDDPAKSLPRCTTRNGRVNMSYLQQRVNDVN